MYLAHDKILNLSSTECETAIFNQTFELYMTAEMMAYDLVGFNSALIRRNVRNVLGVSADV